MQNYNIEKLIQDVARMNRYMKNLTSAAEMTVGTALTAAAFALVIIPNGYAAGGVTGLARTAAQMLSLPLSALVLAVNAALLILGLAFVGKAFVMRTLGVSLLFPMLLEILSPYSLFAPGGNVLAGVLVGGLMLGTGAGLILRSGASMGGFDVIAVVLNRKCRVSVAAVMNICDAAVIIMQAVNQPLYNTLCGIAVITISAAAVWVITSLNLGFKTGRAAAAEAR